MVEARDGGGQEFGSDQVAAELGRDPGRGPRRLLDDLFAAVTRHAPGRPSDDRTAIALLRDADAAVPVTTHTDAIPSHRLENDWFDDDRSDERLDERLDDGDGAYRPVSPVAPVSPVRKGRRRRRPSSRVAPGSRVAPARGRPARR
ncbi:MAG: hypothetical protein ACQSGP_28780 [Frankia sp.]